MPNDRKPEKVGYKKPPRHSRFKKGVSGNPKGRPKRTTSFSEMLEDQYRKTIIITEGGKKKRLSSWEVVVKRLFQMALEGDLKAIRTIIQLKLNKKGEMQELPKVTFNVIRTKERIPPRRLPALERRNNSATRKKE